LTPTAARLEWLHLLDVKPGSDRQGGRTAFDCHMAGWTQWNYRNASGEDMTFSEAAARYGGRWSRHTTIRGERLTATGRQVLATHGSASASR
jgi:hypothetical protein